MYFLSLQNTSRNQASHSKSSQENFVYNVLKAENNTPQNPHISRTAQQWAVRPSWEALLLPTGIENETKVQP